MSKTKLKKALAKATGCTIQYDGWCCGTCFFSLNDNLKKGKLTNKDWQALLLFRGDYKPHDLDNLPKDINRSINKILKVSMGVGE